MKHETQAFAKSPVDTGRVKSLIHPVAQGILYSGDFETRLQNELIPMSQIDLAHLLMLKATGILEPSVVNPLIGAIRKLRDTGFEPLRGRPAPRGTYMLYEGYLIETLGPEIGGSLQTARSRNDLSATMQKMRHRDAVAELASIVLALEEALLVLARAHLETPFPLFTHYQAAQVTTLAQYFLAICTALQRSHAAFVTLLDHLGTCPLGAGAVTGTAFPIDTDMTSHWLGFEKGPDNAIDAVASRDHVLRSIQECATIGVTVSRLAHDLQLWTTRDFGLLDVGDDLVGISSMMPQKRNIYLTENVKGKLATGQGAAHAAMVAMHATPYSNSISVGTEAAKHLWPALQDTGDAIRLITLLVEGVKPDTDRIAERLAEGFCGATALADGLVRHAGMSFRDAHHFTGALINDMQQAGLTDLAVGIRDLRLAFAEVLEKIDLQPADLVKCQAFGGGPAPVVQAKLAEKHQTELTRMTQLIAHRRAGWDTARQLLMARAEAASTGSSETKGAAPC